MQRKKKMLMAFVLLAGTIVVLLLGNLLKEQNLTKEKIGMNREEAARALALSAAKEGELANGAEKEKYSRYLMDFGYWKEEGGEVLSWQELEEFAEKERLHPEGVVRHIQGKAGKQPVTRKQFWDFYEKLAKEKKRGIEKKKGVLAAVDTSFLYLKKETLKREGYPAEEFLDQTITYYKKAGILVGICKREEETVTYSNVLVTANSPEETTVFLYGGFRTFSLADQERLYQDAVLDITIEKQKPTSVRVKSEEIRGKVLSVSESQIELEGYGEIPFSEDFVLYKGYGNYALQQKKDISIGYDIQKFFVAEGKICAGITTRTLEAKHIRVLLSTSEFASRFHEEVTVTCEGSFAVLDGEIRKEYPGGATVTFSRDTDEGKQNRVVVQSDYDRYPLIVTSITRNQGHPSYAGILELKWREEGIVLLNEVLVEDYLLQVVPSEVPSSFQEEALKVQAITARTYACKGIRENALWEYGAHVDDSENFQVYANISSTKETEQAIRDTYGQVLCYEENLADIYYFSTSCGATTGPEIWGGSTAESPYMKPKWIGTKEAGLDLTKEEVLRQYLAGMDENAYEKDCQWFRWRTKLTWEELTASVNANLAERIRVNPALILVRVEDAYQPKEIASVGTVQKVEVLERGSGGTAEKIRIQGSDAEILVSGQTNIRTLLGNGDSIYETVTGPVTTYRQMLQSSFFYLEETEEGYLVVGGGKGHGLGMPQNGMNQMALSGMSASEILAFFFEGTLLLSIY